jgi:1-acyl-sn-glycerol-3-phosphate acyltransferase
LVPIELLTRNLRPGGWPQLTQMFHKILCRSLGLRIGVHGAPVRQGGVFYVANHISYLDIPVLGSQIRAAFVAKSEVAGWGVVGWLSTLARTVYIERERRARTAEQRNAIIERLAQGADVILFPEGTNSDGVSVMPFKSALFAVVEGPEAADFLIQPVTIAYTRVNGMPVTRGQLPDIAWVGDTELAPHAMTMMGLGPIRAEIIFHAAVRAADFADRKALMRHCHSVIAAGYRQLMRGGNTPRPVH